MVISWNLMGLYDDSMGFHGDLKGVFSGVREKVGVHHSFSGDIMGFNWCSM